MLGRQYRLVLPKGSDYHGPNKKEILRAGENRMQQCTKEGTEARISENLAN